MTRAPFASPLGPEEGKGGYVRSEGSFPFLYLLTLVGEDNDGDDFATDIDSLDCRLEVEEFGAPFDELSGAANALGLITSATAT